jgi:hypothetical protein
MGFYLGVDHILVLISLTSQENIKDNWLQQLPLTDTTGCIQLRMVFFKETNANWARFMANLKRAVGTPPLG